MINGVEIYGDAEPHGPQRFGAEVVNALDKLDLSGVKIEVIVPKSLVDLGRVPCFSNLKIVALDYDLNKFKGRFLFSKLTFPRYVTKNGGYGVDLVLSYPLYGCKAVCLFD